MIYSSKPKLALLLTVLVTTAALMVPMFVFTPHSQAALAQQSGGTNNHQNHPFCGRLGKTLQASQGAQAWCFGAQRTSGPTQVAQQTQPTHTTNSFGSNVNAADFTEDRSPSGAQAYGQSETSIAAAGRYVVEAWNDSTSFSSPCGSPMNKEEGVGFGFSTNGGTSFKDLGGLPNANCNTSRLVGDPSVEVYQVGGKTYFYISSIFIPFTMPETAISVTACGVSGSGSSATLSCGDPIIAAISTQCDLKQGYCSFLDKGFLSIDPKRGRLYLSYSEFGIHFFPTDTLSNGQIELTTCDLSTPATPACYNGSNALPATPYLVVAPGDLSCERTGAYPSVDVATGDVYVAHEFNWATNIFGSVGPVDCRGVPTANQVDYVPFSCLTLPKASSSCAITTRSINIVSTDAAFIPGYSRFPGNDYPRVAVSDPAGVLTMVWNDARNHPLGDILGQSFSLGTLKPLTTAPVVLNDDNSGALHFLPALRNSDANGKLSIAWYDRRPNANTTQTNVYAALRVDPKSLKAHNVLVTTGPTDWNAVSSDLIPNFGDYTDIYVVATGSPPYTGTTVYVAWTDGRTGEPQPFEAHL